MTLTISLEEAAKHIGIKPSTLKNRVNKGEGPRFLRMSANTQMRFRTEDLDAWLAAQFDKPQPKKRIIAAPKPAKTAKKKSAGRKKDVAEQQLAA